MEHLSFDSMVEFYDETRVCDRACFDAALDYLAGRFPPETFGHVFEPGVGTGRIAISLARKGYRVTGVDVSERMLTALEKRLAQAPQPLEVSFRTADVTDLSFPNATFDMAVVVHLFYFVREWRKAADEILRVVRPDGPVVLMHTGTGAEIPFVNTRYKELCAEQGCPAKAVGVESTQEVVDHFAGLGCRTETIRDRWQWTSRLRLDEALDYMVRRAYSFTTVAPERAHSAAMTRLETELRERFGSLDTEIEIPNQVYLVVITRR